MSDTLTLGDIKAAQGGDSRATETVLNAMNGRIQSIAQAEARRMLGDVGAYAEEFAQTGRIAVWEALSRFTGESVDDFYAFMFRTVHSSVREAAGEERNPGADKDALKVFAYWVKRCEGDVHLAERMCQTVPPEGVKRLGRDRANAARLAWQVTLSIDSQLWDDENNELNLSFAGALGQESTYGVPEDLVTPSDLSAEDTRQTVAAVRAILDVMGEQTANVLRGSFGITPMSYYGFGRGDNGDAELADRLGMTEKQVKTGRAKGYLSFAKRWVPFAANGDEESAAEWWSAYQDERDRWRRPAEV